jgi:hypothetical protein
LVVLAHDASGSVVAYQVAILIVGN